MANAPVKETRRTRAFLGLVVVVAGAAFLLLRPGTGSGDGGEALARQAAPSADTAEGIRTRSVSEGTRTRSVESIRHQTAQSLVLILRNEQSDRMRAVTVLRNLGPEALKVVRQEFDHQDGLRRDAAAFVLAVVGNAQDRAKVANAFWEQSHNPTPLMALAAAELQDSRLVDLFRVLRTSSNPQVREAAASALRASDWSLPLSEILPLLADPEPRVRRTAERTLTHCLTDAQPYEIRSAATAALASNDPQRRIAGLRLAARMAVRVGHPWVRNLASKATIDRDWRVRAETVKILVEMRRE